MENANDLNDATDGAIEDQHPREAFNSPFSETNKLRIAGLDCRGHHRRFGELTECCNCCTGEAFRNFGIGFVVEPEDISVDVAARRRLDINLLRRHRPVAANRINRSESASVQGVASPSSPSSSNASSFSCALAF